LERLIALSPAVGGYRKALERRGGLRRNRPLIILSDAFGDSGLVCSLGGLECGFRMVDGIS